MKRIVNLLLGVLFVGVLAYAGRMIGPSNDPFDSSLIKSHTDIASTAPSDSSVSITIDKSNFPILQVFANVTDDQGIPIPGLTEDDFCVYQDGDPVVFEVTEVGSQGCPTSVCLVMDVSGSMYGTPLSDAKVAANRFVDNMDVFDQVAIVPFEDCIRTITDFTSDKTTLHNAINALQSYNLTAFFDGVWVGVDITAPQLGAKAVIAFTDGYENNSDVCYPPPDGVYLDGVFSDDSLLICDKANAAGVPVYCLTVGGDSWPDPCIAFSSGTGGYYVHAPSSADIDSLYGVIKETLCSRYLFTYTSPDAINDGDIHQVVICEGGGSCSPCDTGYYQESAAPVVELTPETVSLSDECQAPDADIMICAEVTDASDPFVQEVTLYFRHSEPSPTPYTSTSMSTSGGDVYCATIPGSFVPVGTAGVDYYITASDGEATVSMPATDPQQYPITIPICPNDLPIITHNPPVSGHCADDLVIEAAISDTYHLVAAASLYYRKAGLVFFDSTAMSPSGGDPDVWEGVIPAAYITQDGVEYKMRAWDDLGAMFETALYAYVCDSVGINPTNEWISVYCGTPMLNGVELSPGDIIKAYDPDGVLCGMDTVRADGTFGFMPVYRDDIYSEFVDEGAEPGDLMSFAVNDVEVLTDPEVYWTSNGALVEVCDFYTCKDIHLDMGWNLISWNLDYSASIEDFVATFGDVSCLDVILSFEEGALTFDPLFPDFSTLDYVDYYHGYWIRMNCERNIEICGQRVDDEEYIPIESGWNIVSYWPEDSMEVPTALASILACAEAATGFDDGALAWLPGMDGFNTLTHMKELFGYWIKSSCDADLTYPGWTGPPPSRMYAGGNNDEETVKSVVPGRIWESVFGSNITVNGEPLSDNSMFEMYSPSETLCGQGLYVDGMLKFTPVYGRDELDSETSGYPETGDNVAIHVNGVRVYPDINWNGDGNSVQLARLSTSEFGDSGVLPSDYELSQNYPNPFNPSTVIPFSLKESGHVRLSIYNLLGQRIRTIIDSELEAGNHFAEWNGKDDAGKSISSGVYFYRFDAGTYTEIKKMVLMK